MSRARADRIAVLMGGRSAERAISLQSGQAVLDALTRQGIAGTAIDVADDYLPRLLSGEWDAAFIALHGRGGEDGTIQGVLESLALPYTGSGVLGSALAMDKLRSKALWHGSGLPTPSYRRLTNEDDCHRAIDELGLPLIVKPAREGSSLGMSRVDRAEAIVPAWHLANGFDDEVFAERLITGHELTVAILADEALPVIAIETPRAFYDFDAKYECADTRFSCPAPLSPTLRDRCQSLALEAFAALGCGGWGRIDLFCDEDDAFWLIEANTVPGMTNHSLVPLAAQTAGMDFDALVLTILATAGLSTGERR